MHLNFGHLFENLHCDPNFKENHNVRIKSSKRQLLEMYKNDTCHVVPFKTGLEEIILKLHNIFAMFYKGHQEWVEEDMSEEEIQDVLDKLEEISKLTSSVRPIKEELIAILETHRKMLDTTFHGVVAVG